MAADKLRSRECSGDAPAQHPPYPAKTRLSARFTRKSRADGHRPSSSSGERFGDELNITAKDYGQVITDSEGRFYYR